MTGPNLSQGNTYLLKYALRNFDDTVMNLLGTSELKYQIAKKAFMSPVHSLVLLDPELTITDPSQGLVEIKIPSTVLNAITPGKYIHELWQVDSTGASITLVSQDILITSKLIKE